MVATHSAIVATGGVKVAVEEELEEGPNDVTISQPGTQIEGLSR
jgi:hypothetical protein